MFTVGFHMPGCLPESIPFEMDSWSEAKEVLLHEINTAANVHLEGLDVSPGTPEWQATEAIWNQHLALVEGFTLGGQEMAVTAPDGYRYYLELVQ